MTKLTHSHHINLWIKISYIVLVLERVWLALWPVTAYLSVFGASILFGLLQSLPFTLHVMVLLGGTIGCIFLTYYRLKSLSLPTRPETLQKIERHLELSDRPLCTLEDTLDIGKQDPITRYLWTIHRTHMAKRLHKLRVGFPCPAIARQDPLALRFMAFLLLFISLVVTQGERSIRLTSGLFPVRAQAETSTKIVIDALVTPPEYTRLPTLFLPRPDPHKTYNQNPFDIPQGSNILIRISGVSNPPFLHIADNRATFIPIKTRQYQQEATIFKGNESIVLKDDSKILAHWKIQVIEDQYPSVELIEPPTKTVHNALPLQFKAEDDYGIVDVTALLTPILSESEPISLKLAGDEFNAQKVIAASSFHDLTAHPLAGLSVTLRLYATDNIGQKSSTAPVTFILPEREFTHPVARQIIAIRKKILTQEGNIQDWGMALRTIVGNPHSFDHDIGVFLALNAAQKWLFNQPNTATKITKVPELLWETALYLEDGGLTLALERLRQIQKELKEALENNADEQEIQRLTQELEEALNHFLQALQEQKQQSPTIPQTLSDRILQQTDLQQFLNQMLQFVESGDQQNALKMFNQLQSLLENLDTMSHPSESTVDALQRLQQIIEDQQALIDRTFQEKNRIQQEKSATPDPSQEDPSQDPSPSVNTENLQSLQQQQTRLQQQLQELLSLLSSLPEEQKQEFNKADQEMGNAQGNLPQPETLEQAITHQTNALTHMLQGFDNLIEHLLSQGKSMRVGPSPNPLGQFNSGNGRQIDLDSIDIPEAENLQKAKEILRLLRNRSSERHRPESEREYFERLLKKF